MSCSSDLAPDRSLAPLAYEPRGQPGSMPEAGLRGLSRRLPPSSWLGLSGYLVAGGVLGLVLILTLALTGSGAASAASAAPGPITDNVVHLSAREIGDTCWHATKEPKARLSVSLEVGVDGKVRYAAAAGDSPVMRGCVEAHVKRWEFLPQSEASTMVLPFEVSPTAER